MKVITRGGIMSFTARNLKLRGGWLNPPHVGSGCIRAQPHVESGHDHVQLFVGPGHIHAQPPFRSGRDRIHLHVGPGRVHVHVQPHVGARHDRVHLHIGPGRVHAQPHVGLDATVLDHFLVHSWARPVFS